MMVPTCSGPDTTLSKTIAFRYIHGPGLILWTLARAQVRYPTSSLPLIVWLDARPLASPSLERFSGGVHAPRLSLPPYPPLPKGGNVGGICSFPPLRRGDTGGFFECLCVTPGSAYRRLKTALRYSRRGSYVDTDADVAELLNQRART